MGPYIWHKKCLTLISMQEVAAYTTLAMTVGLVVTRPRVHPRLRLSPALAAFLGVVIMMITGVVAPGDITSTVMELWRPLVAVAAIMVMTEVALRLGVLDWWAAHIEARAQSATQLFTRLFMLGVATAALLNNDAAVLLLTPLVVRLVRRRFPGQPALVVPFAFAIFMAAGVAPLVVSNPMNMVVADFAGIGFNAYAVRMVPIAVTGWAIAWLLLRWLYRDQLAGAVTTAHAHDVDSTPAQRRMMLLLLTVMCGYAVTSALRGPVWPVAVAGAGLALWLAAPVARPVSIVREGVSWETLAFLLAVIALSTGLDNVGLVARLSAYYQSATLGEIGIISALGSAVLNNHPMAYLNMMALEAVPQHGMHGVLAALIGGDLGPRLLPMGSLAGLLWLERLHRHGVHISIRQFIGMGLWLTVPTLMVSLLLLTMMP